MKPWFPIVTERLLLRRIVRADESDIHAYASDVEVVRFEPWGPNSPEKTSAVVTTWLTQQERWPRRAVTLGIELKSEQRLIGTMELRVKDEPNRTADFGYALNRSYWGRGYATEAARAIVDAAFRHLGLHRVWASCDIRNHGSYRVMEKLGMRREGLFRKDVLLRDGWRDSYVYAILEEEWR